MAPSGRYYLCFVLLFTSAVLGAHAEERPEKFALLVGETNYLQPPKDKNYTISILQGPGNDVALMRQLLVKRYGFKDDPVHIEVLTGPEASREGITKAFQTQLIDNAKARPDAKVVFYFSGHGSTTSAPDNAEPDGKYDTLVAYDSRALGGRDIVEDEIRGWLDTLRGYTQDITVILDSCDSGRATRGQAVARGLPPNPNMKLPVAGKGISSDPTPPHLLRRQQYVAIAASQADEYSYEDVIPEASGNVDGFLTWTLFQTLDQQADVTWRQAMVQVRRGVAAHTTQQHPQIAGDLDRLVFGGATDRQAPFVAITDVGAGGVLTVAAGTAQGLNTGATLAIYAPTANVLVGDDNRIATATVVATGLGTSTAKVVETPPPHVPINAKVAIVTPFYGTSPIAFRARSLPNQVTTDADRAVLTTIRAKLAKSVVVKVVGSDEPWRYSIQRGCLGENNQLLSADAAECRSVYYLAGAESAAPAMNRFIPADTTAAEGIVDAVTSLARRLALEALSNNQSRLRLDLEVLGIDVQKTPTGQSAPSSQPHALTSNSPSYVNVGDFFTFALTNKSDRPVFYVLLILNNDGTIALVSDSPTGDRLLQNTRVVLPTPNSSRISRRN